MQTRRSIQDDGRVGMCWGQVNTVLPGKAALTYSHRLLRVTAARMTMNLPRVELRALELNHSCHVCVHVCIIVSGH